MAKHNSGVMVFLAHALNGRDPTHGTLKLILDAVFDSGLPPRFFYWLCHRVYVLLLLWALQMAQD
jgi:hypothetical protein